MVFNKTIMACALGAVFALNGCTRSQTAPNSPPTAQIIQSGNNQVTAFANDQDGDNLTYKWTVNNVPNPQTGRTIILNDVTGAVTIVLEVSDGKETVTVIESYDFTSKQAPVASIMVDSLTGQAPYSLNFDGSGSTDDGNIVRYSWSIDGKTRLGDEISYSFASDGDYDVILTVTDNDGLIGNAEVTINVTPANERPVAKPISSVLSGTVPLDVVFDGSTSTDDVGIEKYTWVIANESFNESIKNYTFQDSGTYIVKLIVEDEKGLRDEKTLTIEVEQENGAPTAVAVADVLTGNAPLTVNFDASQSDDDGGKSNLTYSWSIDGNTFTEISKEYTFIEAIKHPVQLKVTDQDGKSDVDTIEIDVKSINQPPVSNPTSNVTSGEAPLTVRFFSDESTDDKGIVEFSWVIDNIPYNSESPSVTFTEPGTYSAILTVKDAEGEIDSSPITINVEDGGVIVRPITDVLPDYDGVIPLIKMIGDTSADLQTTGNPFSDSYFYASPDVYHAINETSLDFETESQSPSSMYQKMKYTQRMPSAIWMDSTETIGGSATRRSLTEHLDAALAQQQDYQDNADGGQIAPMLVVIIIYNLPDRDCAALASSGLLVEVGDDTKLGDPAYAADVGTGLNKYKEEYIDVIAAAFNDSKYDSLRIVAMLEPDSYPNMLTNQDPQKATDAYCIKLHDVDGDTSGENGVYVQGLRYAINAFAEDGNSNVYTYLDIGHSGWLGWDGNRDLAVNGGITQYWNSTTASEDAGGAAIGFTKLIEDAHPSGLSAVRGFASNTSGYTPLFEYNIEGKDASDNYFEWNKYVDELHFMEVLNTEFKAAGFAEGQLGFIIDTARNGWGKTDGTGSQAQYNRPTKLGAPDADAAMANRVDKRTHRGRWCNVMDAGVGESPQTDPLANHPWIDAFYWMKPPGESDGSSNPADANTIGKSYDPVCGGEGTPKTGEVEGRVIGNAAGRDTRSSLDSFFAPTAGLWFDEQYRMLINNAYPALGSYGDYDDYDYSTAVSAE
ncbi:glycoside hydrolase family 6 protein [Marinicellulosiphila megalodicopiae]|uniref:glycoside hydrolase family 6 protein n=1 Tax=Marinicellulosiphila megalodicopiae TaxID=2724896 RepID=UPI003BB0F8CA